MTASLTPQQKRTYDFVVDRVNADGVGPSYREICAHIGIKSTSGAHRIIHELIDRKLIKKRPATARDYIIVDQSQEYLCDLLKRAMPLVSGASLYFEIQDALEARHAA